MKHLLAFMLAGLLLLGCGSDPDLLAIRESISKLSVAAENHDADGILVYVDNSYTGVGGNRTGVANLLNTHFSLNKNINIIISDINIQLAEDRQTANVSVRVLLTGGNDSKLPERGQLSSIKSTWKKQDKEWRVIKASWKPVLLKI